MEKNRRMLTIGQFAALHGINKKTLMWYDEIGLFHPAAVHPENGYRYYSYRQSSLLETILLLRELDVPIDEIQTFLVGRSAASLEALLGAQLEKLDREITHLNAVRETLAHQQRNLSALRAVNSELTLVQTEERRLVTVDIAPPFDRQVELITAETKKHSLRRLHDASYGIMIPVKYLLQGDFTHYTKLFIEIPSPAAAEGLHIRPAGSCLRAFYRDAGGDASPHYRRLLDHARSHGLVPCGFAYEVILNETVIDREEDAIVQIELPVRPAP